MFLNTKNTVAHSAPPQAQRGARTRIRTPFIRGKLFDNTQKTHLTPKKVLKLKIFFSLNQILAEKNKDSIKKIPHLRSKYSGGIHKIFIND